MEFRGWLTEQNEYADELEELIRKAHDPMLKKELEQMRGSGDLGIYSTAFTRGEAKKEPFKDILSALKQKERESGLPLLGLFGAMLTGRGNDFERARFGRQVADTGHGIIVSALEQYAKATGNWELLQLVQKYKDDPSRPNPYRPQPQIQQGKPKD